MQMTSTMLSIVSSPSLIEQSDDEHSDDVPITKQQHDNDLLIVMDWDDTLFPTHAFGSIILASASEDEFICAMRNEHHLLCELDEYCIKLYTLLKAVILYHGAHNLFIITNAQDGWIEHCLAYSSLVCDRFKLIHDLLFTTHNIAIVSAQSMFSKQLPYSAQSPLAPLSWKQMAFCYLLKSYLVKSEDDSRASRAPPQLVTIGDQNGDHHLANRAVRELVEYNPLHHIIKCKAEPSVQEMMNELSYMTAAFRCVLMESQFMKTIKERKAPQMLWDCEHMRFGYSTSSV
eukprot:515420_1